MEVLLAIIIFVISYSIGDYQGKIKQIKYVNQRFELIAKNTISLLEDRIKILEMAHNANIEDTSVYENLLKHYGALESWEQTLQNQESFNLQTDYGTKA